MKGNQVRENLPLVLPKVMERRGEHAVLPLTNHEILTDNARKRNNPPRDGLGLRGQWRAGCAKLLGCRVHRDGRACSESNGKAGARFPARRRDIRAKSAPGLKGVLLMSHRPPIMARKLAAGSTVQPGCGKRHRCLHSWARRRAPGPACQGTEVTR